MGRSTTSSCFKIISSCGGGGSDQSQDKDDIIHVSNSTQNKSPEKRGWSFRKRSARHRVLSNTVVTSETKETQIPSSVNKESSVTEIPEKKESFINELPTSENKESSKAVTISAETIVNSSKADDSIDNQWTEEMPPRLSNSITKDSTVLTMTNEAACEDDVKRESVVSESATTEAAREDGVKYESGLNESAMTEAAREDDGKCESGLNESATTEADRKDDVKHESRLNESATTEAGREDDVENDESGLNESATTEAAREDGVKCESGLSESATTEAAREDDVKHESGLNESATAEAAREDDVKHESGLNESATAEAACEDDVKCESSLNESAILVIQAAVRRFLAQKQLNREKNVVKLQAAVRGHLVRNHAVGTLRCVQAIVKMQALVRARHAERSADGETVKKHPTYVSTEKLLSNKLARQLLESTPKTKQINIKCDPSKSDSAWSWLGRWMTASTPETVEPHAQDQDEVKAAETEVETVTIHCESTDVKSEVGKASVQEDSIDMEQDSNVRNREEEEPQPANAYTSDSIKKPDFPADEPMDLNTGVGIEVSSVSEKPVSETEPKRAAKRFATDLADSEGRKSVFGSRKASNPAFIAAQSRFEELTSKTNPLKPVDSFNQDDEPRSSEDIIAPENATVTTDGEPEQHSVSRSLPVVPNGGSECGTELSVTSTLDSPERSEVENKKPEEEPKVSDEPVEERAYPNSNETSSDLLVSEKHDNGDDSKTENPKPADNVEEKLLDNNTPEADIELEPESNNAPMESEHETVHQSYKSSGEASPKSHTTVPESQGTPSSQVSTNTKKAKTDKKASSQKRKSWSSSKKTSVTSSPESGVRRSLEQLPKDSKSGKRRNSFGSPRPDHVDQEASGNSTVPSYMQATESARAKAIANSSPRSSPDVQQDKEMYMKKRHSLPGAVNGRQGSPRIQRSMSQALQSTKGNGSQEKKWQR